MATARKLTDDGFPTGLNVDEFLVWYEQQSGRYELHDGDVFAMAPARVRHASAKARLFTLLNDAVRRANLPCHTLPDGIAVHVSDTKWYEPDALVYCGPEAPGDDISIANPVIVVEVASPSTARLDETAKLSGYFLVPSVQHYLIVYPGRPPLVHHQRQADGTILTRLLSTGPLRLDPPGIEIDVTELFN
jgi:Uma2 family endonuclease